MLYSLYIYSRSRPFWFLLIITTIILELGALYLQYFFLLKPCVLCIYQRCAIFGITISGCLGIIAPTINSLRYCAIFIWIYSAGTGLSLAKKQITIQLHPSPFFTCDLFVQFPHWLPLNKWLPFIFNATSDCFEYKWNFLSLDISQWMLIIFINYLIISLIICLIQLKIINNH